MKNLITIFIFFLFSITQAMEQNNRHVQQNRNGVTLNGYYYPFNVWFFGGNTYTRNFLETIENGNKKIIDEIITVTTWFCFEPYPYDPNLYQKRTKRTRSILSDRITEEPLSSDSSDTDSSDESESDL